MYLQSYLKCLVKRADFLGSSTGLEPKCGAVSRAIVSRSSRMGSNGAHGYHQEDKQN